MDILNYEQLSVVNLEDGNSRRTQPQKIIPLDIITNFRA